jgi:hypothetical protein
MYSNPFSPSPVDISIIMGTFKKVAIVFLFLSFADRAFCQNGIKRVNIFFLDSLNKIYGGLCAENKKVK